MTRPRIAFQHRLLSWAPTLTAVALIAGNLGLMLRRGLHPNVETAVGFLWIAADLALRQKPRYPLAAPRLNAIGIIAGSFALSLSGIHHGFTDWSRVRTPLGYVPAALVVGFQNEIRTLAHSYVTSGVLFIRFLGKLLRFPYSIAAVINAYGVFELWRSAVHLADGGLVLISAAYALATITLPLFDIISQDCAPDIRHNRSS